MKIMIALTIDNGSNYTCDKVEQLLRDYGIAHRVASVGNPHSHCRAELAVKVVKCMLRKNRTLTSNLDTVRVSCALLQYRNTKDHDAALLLFSQELHDFVPRPEQALMVDMWMDILSHREKALAEREVRDKLKWS